MRQVSSKFSIDRDQIIKTSNGEKIPEDEPVFILRARDNLALHLLYEYYRLSKIVACNEYHFKLIDETISKFEKFKVDFPTRMKQPSITKGI